MTTFDRRFDALTPTGKLIVENAGDWLAVAESIEALGGASDANAVDYTGDTPSNYTPVAATAEGHLEGIDAAVGSAGGSFSGARLTKAGGSSQDFNDTTAELTVTWDTEVHDSNGWSDLVADNTIFTIPSGVTKVNISAMIYCKDTPAADPGTYHAYLYHDDGETPVAICADYRYVPASATGQKADVSLYMTTDGFPVSEGDTFYITVWTEDGTNSNTVEAGILTQFTIRKVD